MSDPRSAPRPIPQYGEYATPEEVAALRGVAVEAPLAEAPPAPAPAAVGGPAAPGGRRYDRPVTIALLLFGAINLVQYGAALLDFDTFLESATAGTPTESIDFGDAARVGGYVLFGVSLLLFLVAGFVSVQRLRRGRVAFWVPLVAGALTVASWVVVLVAIVFQTPDALAYPLALTASGT
ncbi:DUF6264 family protein [Pseudolysinimonas sp.]|uniref:DUF6264 family protein n=1 Tax=Pseudolysinimonas sp. TaxID=2680009 RepID=UPI003784F120